MADCSIREGETGATQQAQPARQVHGDKKGLRSIKQNKGNVGIGRQSRKETEQEAKEGKLFCL